MTPSCGAGPTLQHIYSSHMHFFFFLTESISWWWITWHCTCCVQGSALQAIHHLYTTAEQQQNSPLVTPWIARSIIHILVFGSVSGHHHSSHPPPPLLDISCCHLSLTWTCWESLLLFLRGDKPISKAGACRVGWFAPLQCKWEHWLGWSLVTKRWPSDGHNQCQSYITQLPELPFPCFLFPNSCSQILLSYT